MPEPDGGRPAEALRGKRFQVYSAGTSPSRIHPMAIEVTAEKGISQTNQRSKSIDEFLGHGFDIIVTTCDVARDRSPVFLGHGKRLHWGLADPV